MRLIDGDKLLEEFRRWQSILNANSTLGCSEYLDGLKRQLKMCLIMVEEADTIDAWIDATEDVPPTSVKEYEGDSWMESNDVLVATTDGKVTIGYYEDDLDVEPSWHSIEHGDRIDVTHWMELPKIPEVSSSGA